ncbi:MAG: neutral zinc metallopeptidase [Actinobacteria bacterium]|nr:neutral zinc metallopeptidase [Actinomycetota bacterium]
MKYRDDAQLDTSQVQDTRRTGLASPGKLAVGGGGVGLVGVIIAVILALTSGGNGSSSQAVVDILGQLGQNGQPVTADNSQVAAECRTGADANKNLDCAVVADIDSIQGYWTQALPSVGTTYVPIPTVWFSGQVTTACGAASSGSGPFYCPGDKRVYIDLTFYDDLKTQFGAQGGLFVDAYVLAHEYGHHVQDLLGTEAKVQPGQTGATSGSVRLELQADCYAGVWAYHATTTPDASGQPLITGISQDDINRALDTASRIGDDFIQKNLGSGRVDQNSFTHGTSAQRQKWFTTGYRSGQPSACDTFGPGVNLG